MVGERQFWTKVRKTDGCWRWTAAKVTGGYGGFKVNGRMVRAHRFSWELQYGPIPTGLIICHRCDVRDCVNPAHLFLGTHRDNKRDAIQKGRAVDLAARNRTPAMRELSGRRLAAYHRDPEFRRKVAATQRQRFTDLWQNADFRAAKERSRDVRGRWTA